MKWRVRAGRDEREEEESRELRRRGEGGAVRECGFDRETRRAVGRSVPDCEMEWMREELNRSKGKERLWRERKGTRREARGRVESEETREFSNDSQT